MNASIDYVIGVDVGTGGCKVTVLGSDNAIAAESYVPYESHYEQPLWVEHDPDDWVSAAKQGIALALDGFEAAARSRVTAIAFSGPHHTAVLLDANNRPLRRAILWNDQRSAAESRRLTAEHGELIYGLTNNRPAPTWTLAQMAWLQEHEPDTYARIVNVVFMKDYVRLHFCGERSTDYIEGEGTLFFDLHERRWSEELLALIDLNPEAMPPVRAPLDFAGRLLPEVAAELGLSPQTQTVMGAADSAAEVYGAGAASAGMGTVKLATAGNFALVTDQLIRNPGLLVYEHLVDGLYYMNSSTNSAASAFRWFVERFYSELEAEVGSRAAFQQIDAQVADIPAGSDGLFFHPYLNGERSPHWDSQLRASFVGVTFAHERAHFARSVMEGVCYSIRDARSAFGKIVPDSIRLIGGGGRSAVWGQMVADVLGTSVEVPAVTDSSFGTSLVAATASGWFESLTAAVQSAQRIVRSIDPSPETVDVYDRGFEIYKEITVATTPISHHMAEEAGGR